MITLQTLALVKRDAAELARYSVQMSVVLGMICSLAAVAILSKNQVTNHLWAGVAAIAAPIPIALYFRRQIVPLGTLPFVGALILALGAAVLFGI